MVIIKKTYLKENQILENETYFNQTDGTYGT